MPSFSDIRKLDKKTEMCVTAYHAAEGTGGGGTKLRQALTDFKGLGVGILDVVFAADRVF